MIMQEQITAILNRIEEDFENIDFTFAQANKLFSYEFSFTLRADIYQEGAFKYEMNFQERHKVRWDEMWKEYYGSRLAEYSNVGTLELTRKHRKIVNRIVRKRRHVRHAEEREEREQKRRLRQQNIEFADRQRAEREIKLEGVIKDLGLDSKQDGQLSHVKEES